jgi:enoyl-CoA hydratase/carnithine racemase
MNASHQAELISLTFDQVGANITLNRPHIGNALNPDMVSALNTAFDEALQNGARLIIFRGSGKHMCTGFDLGDVETCTDGDLLLRFVRIEQLLQKIFRSPVMTVAIGSGRVYGAGADLFACCDRRIGLPEASFAFPGSGFGLVLGTRRLAERIGRDAARRMLIAGNVIPATEAAGVGLVTDFCDAADLGKLLMEIAAEASRLPAPTVAALHAVTSLSDDETDLAALVQSASYPGLKDRIKTYRQAIAPRKAKD